MRINVPFFTNSFIQFLLFCETHCSVHCKKFTTSVFSVKTNHPYVCEITINQHITIKKTQIIIHFYYRKIIFITTIITNMNN